MRFETCVRFYFTIALLNFAWYINRVWYRWIHLRIVNRVLIRRDYFVASVDLHHIYHTQTIHRPTLAPQHPDTDKRLINALNSEQTDRHPSYVTSLVKYDSYGFELCVLVNMMAELRFYLKCVDFRSGLALRVADWSDDVMLVAFSG